MSERPRILFLHTGGTLGMTGRAPGPLAPSHYEETVLPYVRGLEEIAEIEGRVVCNVDSSDMAPENWEAIGQVVSDEFDSFDDLPVALAAFSRSFKGVHSIGRPDEGWAPLQKACAVSSGTTGCVEIKLFQS